MPRRAMQAAVVAAVAVFWAQPANAQLSYTQGETISPAYEGFELNPDGSYNLMFGYMNKNWEEELDVPVGPDNYFSFTSPGGLDDLTLGAYDASAADMGQPTHFLPRRNRHTFRVHVPADVGDQELVWTLTTQGEIKRAFASLRQDLLVDNMVIASETGALGAGSSSPESRSNVAPVVAMEGDVVIEARVGQPVTLVARVTDDGLPLSRAARAARAREERLAAEAAAAEEEEEEEAHDDDADPDHDGDDADGSDDPADDDAADDDAEEGEAAEDEDADEEEELSPELQALQRAFREPGRITVGKVSGLHYTWFVYRGPDTATFEPIQVKSWEDSRAWMNSPWSPYWVAPPIPEDGRWVVDVTFDEPGTYVLRGRADDGAMFADQEITINVTPLLN
jgi:hypothetical protein